MLRDEGNLHLAMIAITPRSWIWRVTRAGYLSPKALLRAFLFCLSASPDTGTQREGENQRNRCRLTCLRRFCAIFRRQRSPLGNRAVKASSVRHPSNAWIITADSHLCPDRAIYATAREYSLGSASATRCTAFDGLLPFRFAPTKSL